MQLKRDTFHRRKWNIAALVLKNGLNAHAARIGPDAEWRVILGTFFKAAVSIEHAGVGRFFDTSNQRSYWFPISLALAMFKFSPQ